MATQTLSDSAQHLYQKKEDVFSSDLGKEIVLLHHSKGIYFGLKGVGIHVWPLLTEPITLSQLLKKLLITISGLPAHGESEIKAFLLELLNAGLIDVTDASNS